MAVDPLGLAGLLREKPLDAVACRSVDLLVPAESDVIIEGYIDPQEAVRFAEPRLSPSGRVERGRDRHIMHLTAVTHRANRVFPAAVPGNDDNECCVRDRVMSRLFLPYLRLRIPELVDFDLPLSGGARHLAVLAIEKTYKAQARHVATVAWGMRPFEFARLLVVVDANIDVRDEAQILAAIVREANWISDLIELDGPCDPLDPASPWGQPGRRMAIDATRALYGESDDPITAFVEPDESVQRLVTNRWTEYGLGPEASS
jgi:4-hydroxy-3-polyprenylbenzoate decarboxylase